MREKIEWALWFKFRLGGSPCSNVQAMDGYSTQPERFPLRKSNSIMSGNCKRMIHT